MKLLLPLLFTLPLTVLADDNNISNSNNTNYSTTAQTNNYTSDNSGQTFNTTDNSLDNSLHTSIDSSTGNYRDNTVQLNSNNQLNQSLTNQNINNSVTKTVEGGLTENSYNNSGNTVGTNANGEITNNQGQGQGQDQRQQQGLAATVTVAPSYINKNAPMAWSPNMAMSMSQENCNNSATIGVSGVIGGVSGGVPINDDDCTRRRDAILWANLGQMRIACERMTQDASNEEAMKSAGVDCSTITSSATIVPLSRLLPSPVAQNTANRLDSLAETDRILNDTFARYMQK